MVYPLDYTRPKYVSAEETFPDNSSTSGDEKRDSSFSSHNGGYTAIAGIPEELSFDRIITGGTCPVSSLSLPPTRSFSMKFVNLLLVHGSAPS
jgi:hypothetical protein